MCGKPHGKNMFHFKINPDMCKIAQNTYVRIHVKEFKRNEDNGRISAAGALFDIIDSARLEEYGSKPLPKDDMEIDFEDNHGSVLNRIVTESANYPGLLLEGVIDGREEVDSDLRKFRIRNGEIETVTADIVYPRFAKILCKDDGQKIVISRVRQLRKEIIDNITSILKGIPGHRAEFRRWDPEQQDEEILYDVLVDSREEGCYPTVMNVHLAPNDMVVVALSIQSGDFELPATDSDLSTDDLANINDVLIEMSIVNPAKP